MFHHRDGVLIHGVSKTKVAAIVEDGGRVLASEPQPKDWEGKGAAPVHSNFQNMSRPHTSRHDTELGNAILRDAMGLGYKK
jgi:hypothetical protein